MSTEQIQQILKRLDEQDKKSEERLTEQHNAFQSIRNDIQGLQNDLRPIHKIFENATGFNKISVLMVKIILGFAAVLTALGTIAYFIRELIIRIWKA